MAFKLFKSDDDGKELIKRSEYAKAGGIDGVAAVKVVLIGFKTGSRTLTPTRT